MPKPAFTPNAVVAMISLGYSEGKSNKAWAGIVLGKGDTCQYIALWGRRHHAPQFQRGPFGTQAMAMAQLNTVSKAKLDHGYKQVDLSWSQGMQPAIKQLIHTPLTQDMQVEVEPITVTELDVPDWTTGTTTVTSATTNQANPTKWVAIKGNNNAILPNDMDLACTTCQRWPGVWQQISCDRCGGAAVTHNAHHPHASLLLDCPSLVLGTATKNLPLPKVEPDENAIPHLECQCGHCMNSHGAIDGTIPCLVSTCTCEGYRSHCQECGQYSTDGGWHHELTCVTGFRLMPQQRGVQKLHRQPRRTSDLVEDDI